MANSEIEEACYRLFQQVATRRPTSVLQLIKMAYVHSSNDSPDVPLIEHYDLFTGALAEVKKTVVLAPPGYDIANQLPLLRATANRLNIEKTGLPWLTLTEKPDDVEFIRGASVRATLQSTSNGVVIDKWLYERELVLIADAIWVPTAVDGSGIHRLTKGAITYWFEKEIPKGALAIISAWPVKPTVFLWPSTDKRSAPEAPVDTREDIISRLTRQRTEVPTGADGDAARKAIDEQLAATLASK